ncbi:MAG: alpha/beta hydrolase [Pseudomonadota bacterium]
MSDLLRGFRKGSATLADVNLAYRTGGKGAPLVLLHGYPQSQVMWHAIAPALAEDHTVYLFDLPGYGASGTPEGGPARYAKRAMAADIVAAMAQLGHHRFAVAGHDRGGRVAYRMALDAPDVVTRLAVLDIVPTGAVWNDFSVARALRYYHWTFLAQPAPLPETLIKADPVDYLDRTMASWTKAKDLSAFHPDAMAAYRAAFSNPAHLHAMCEDYRAGATVDWTHDDESVASGARITTPLLVLWGAAFDAGGGRSPLDVWRAWHDAPEGAPVDAGHFLCEENPDETLRHLRPFLAGR